MNKKLNFVILAGGRGKRMKSSVPKPLKKILGKSMLQRIVKAGKGLNPDRLIVVESDSRVKEAARELGCRTVKQGKPLGTADALKTAVKLCTGKGNVLVTCADIPLITEKILKELYLKHVSSEDYITILSAKVDDPAGYGRVVKNGKQVVKIVEDKEAGREEKSIKLINSGIYCFKRKNLKKYLDQVEKSPVNGEYYLTDLVEIVINKGLGVQDKVWSGKRIMGVNTPEQLKNAEVFLRENRRI
ncbi:MAG: NTP transferase domain-containing protein [Elusimicrobiota bacterium]